jgi:hypothetical protein
MAMAPKQDDQSEDAEGMAELDAKMIRALHRQISNKGIAEPILKGRGAEYEAFAAGLQSIAAEECYSVVNEFLELSKTVTADSEEPEAALLAHVKDAAQADTLAALSERYRKATEEDQPAELLKDYLKEQKKVS